MWSHLKWMRVNKADFILKYKTTNDPLVNTEKIDFTKRRSQVISSSLTKILSNSRLKSSEIFKVYLFM